MANGKINGYENIYSVLVDEGRGMELVVEHLFSKGHRNIAYVVDKDTEAASRKQSGFIRKMKEFGFEQPEENVYRSDYGLSAGAQIGPELKEKGYDAIMFGEDLTAVGALNALRTQGCSIPEDIAITGCNNSEYSYICSPGLTTVNNKSELLSELTIELLMNLLNKEKETASLIVIPELIIRETT
jgi:LacI family transcriptional regulator